MHGILHPSAAFVVAAVTSRAVAMEEMARSSGLSPNFDYGKTETILALMGQGAKWLKKAYCRQGWSADAQVYAQGCFCL